MNNEPYIDISGRGRKLDNKPIPLHIALITGFIAILGIFTYIGVELGIQF